MQPEQAHSSLSECGDCSLRSQAGSRLPERCSETPPTLQQMCCGGLPPVNLCSKSKLSRPGTIIGATDLWRDR